MNDAIHCNVEEVNVSLYMLKVSFNKKSLTSSCSGSEWFFVWKISSHNLVLHHAIV